MSNNSPGSIHADSSAILGALDLLTEPGQVVELRIIGADRKGNRTDSGYFDDMQRLAQVATTYSGRAAAVYITLNPINPALLARSANRVTDYARQTTSDNDIIRRRWLPIDLDPMRPSGISSSEAEHKAAIERAYVIRDSLRREGWPDPIIADSGNGAHLLYRIDAPPDDNGLVKRTLSAIAFRFSDGIVQIDESVHNPARIWKVYGTLAAKGDSLPDRPHRLARLLEVPETMAVVPADTLARMAATLPTAEVNPASPLPTRSRFDIAAWIGAHAAQLEVVKGPFAWNGGQKWILSTCPWNPDHTDGAAYIVQLANGAIQAGCHHNGCNGHDWHALRDLVEPDWRHAGTQPGSLSASAQFSFVSLDDLLQEPEEDVHYVWEGVLPAKGFSIFGGKPKTGKTTTVRALAWKVARGEPFLGRATVQGKVLYLALEEKRGEVAASFRKMGGAGTDIYIHVGASPEDGMAALASAIGELRPALVIIDTLARIIRVKDFNDYAEMSRALEPLIDLARASGAHIMCIHHLGKGDREDGDDLLGSTALLGSVDTLLSLKRRRSAIDGEALRALSSLQRYGDNLAEMILTYDKATGAVESVGDLETLQLNAMRQKVLEALGHEALTEPDIKERVEGKAAIIQKALRALLAENRIVRSGAGRRGDPYKYAAETHLSHPTYTGDKRDEHFTPGASAVPSSTHAQKQNTHPAVPQTVGDERMRILPTLHEAPYSGENGGQNSHPVPATFRDEQDEHRHTGRRAFVRATSDIPEKYRRDIATVLAWWHDGVIDANPAVFIPVVSRLGLADADIDCVRGVIADALFGATHRYPQIAGATVQRRARAVLHAVVKGVGSALLAAGEQPREPLIVRALYDLHGDGLRSPDEIAAALGLALYATDHDEGNEPDALHAALGALSTWITSCACADSPYVLVGKIDGTDVHAFGVYKPVPEAA